MTAYSAHIAVHHAKRVLLMNNSILKKCSHCFAVILHNWQYCTRCGCDVSQNGQYKMALSFPVVKTEWGEAKLKEIYQEEVAFFATSTTLKEIKNSVSKMLFEDESVAEHANSETKELPVDIPDKTEKQKKSVLPFKGMKDAVAKELPVDISDKTEKPNNKERVLPFKGIKDSVSKMLFEGEIVEPIDLGTDEKRELIVDITDRTVKQNGKERVLLQDIHLKLCDGEMCLILGGSGAGKTTFLNAVMGSERANAQVTYGGIDLYKDYDRLKHFIGYVAQMDPLRMDDTVYMTLHSAAQLKLPRQIVEDKEQLNQRIQMVLETVSLTEESENLVRKLSGGQKKRLNIAVEYITNPHLFFLDEPDSGLDGSQARILMENLRRIADTGKIVMLISHVPDRVLHLFDKVIVLAKDKRSGVGTLSFFGSVTDALAHYQTQTLEEIVSVLDKQSGVA
ncbi:MAG: ATP-binding cassette domain-containing protein [Neisseriaceae bacterium]|nr:ATP-binding cassette domain-containing protein [Neisseriaceae bacterium]